MKKILKQTTAVLLTVCVLSFSLSTTVINAMAEEQHQGKSDTKITTHKILTGKSYAEYLQSVSNAPQGAEEILLNAENVSASEDIEILGTFEGEEKVVKTDEVGFVEYTFTVPKAGLYNMNVMYYPISGKGTRIARSLSIDGALPFEQAREIVFHRIWADSGKITQNKNGNDVVPAQVEAPRWVSMDLSDGSGYFQNPFCFYLSEGTHTLRLESLREPMAIGSIRLYSKEATKSYAEVIAAYKQQGVSESTGYFEKIQGEEASFKSDAMLYPTYDRSSPATEPSDPICLKYNIIGGEKWEENGQWISWEIDNVPEDGLYKIAFKARQNVLNGAYSTRKLYVNGETPFSEAGQIEFSYSTDWKMKTLQVDGKDAYIFLKKGRNEIRLEASLGNLSSLLNEINDCMSSLNEIYKNILMVTGPSPDVNRDYQFHIQMPEIIEELGLKSEQLLSIFERYKSITGQNGEQAQILNKLYIQTQKMSKTPRLIPQLFSSFKTNIADLGTFMITSKQQPLEIDYIVICSPEKELPEASVSFWRRLVYDFRVFIASFFNDYNAMGSDAETGEAITVWVGNGATGGRDQAQLLKRLIDNSFSPNTDIRVNLQLVSMGSLLTATLANKGPDVALSLSGSDPVNYAIRNAVLDLTQFNDYKEVITRFEESSLVPLSFGGGLYGLPETQTFYMLFYRKDILQELNLELPQTWDDVIDMLSVLQKKQLSFGMPQAIGDVVGMGINAYAMFLYQNGGELYQNEGVSSALLSKQAIDSFFIWTRFYTDYSLDVQYDFVNRFRSGEVPIGIADYTTYNNLAVFAPEISGLWDFDLVPGMLQQNGHIDRSVPGAVTASVILSQSEYPKESWEFLKWWTSAQVQADFGKELEAIMGAAARYSPANKEALYQIPWTRSAFETISKQRQWVKGIPEVPGGYYTPRYVDFAFRDVVNSGVDPGEAMEDAVVSINDELTTKRKEFGLTE